MGTLGLFRGIACHYQTRGSLPPVRWNKVIFFIYNMENKMVKLNTCLLIVCFAVSIGVAMFYKRASNDSIGALKAAQHETITKDIIVFKIIEAIRILLTRCTRNPYSSVVLHQRLYLDREEFLTRKRQYLESMTLSELKLIDIVKFVRRASTMGRQYGATNIEDFECTLKESKNITTSRIMADYGSKDQTVNSIIAQCINTAVDTNADVFNEGKDSKALRFAISNRVSQKESSVHSQMKLTKGDTNTLLTY